MQNKFFKFTTLVGNTCKNDFFNNLKIQILKVIEDTL